MQQTTHCTGVMHTAMIQHWQELKAGCCQNGVEYWKMYRHVCTMYIHIGKFLSMYMKWTGITYLYRHMYNYSDIFVCTWYKHVHTMYIQVLHSCTCTNMSVHGSDMSVPFCQILSRWSGFQPEMLDFRVKFYPF